MENFKIILETFINLKQIDGQSSNKNEITFEEIRRILKLKESEYLSLELYSLIR